MATPFVQGKLRNEPLSFENLPGDGLYWLVAEESRRLERIFTLVEGRQRFW